MVLATDCEDHCHLFGTGFRVAPWPTSTVVVGGYLLGIFVDALPDKLLSAVTDRYLGYWSNHFKAYMFLATDGMWITHLILSMFLGCVIALAAKGREMVATITLVLVFCGMLGAAVLVWAATGQALILWMVLWHAADWCAIVIGGAIVRTRRSAATTLP
jgi:hypothetical protein